MNKVNISIDDVSPHPKSSINVVNQCYKILEKFPDAKFTLFVPLAYWRTMPAPPESFSKEPFQIDLYDDFCQYIKDLPTSNFEIGYHGLFHGIPGKSNNDEFRDLTREEAQEKFLLMKDIAERAGLENTFKSIFRPPAWRMSPGAFEASKDLNIEILALSNKDYVLESYKGKNKEFDNVVYYNVNPRLDDLALYPNTEIVYHACEWDRNYLDSKKTESLINFLSENQSTVEFCFMEGLLNGKI